MIKNNGYIVDYIMGVFVVVRNMLYESDIVYLPASVAMLFHKYCQRHCHRQSHTQSQSPLASNVG